MQVVSSYPAHFPLLGEHDDDGGVVLPQHPPEVLHGLVERALSGDVGAAVPVAVDVARVDVVATFDTCIKLNSCERCTIGILKLFLSLAGQVDLFIEHLYVLLYYPSLIIFIGYRKSTKLASA